ncbi:MAG: hypothetical protein AAGC55_13975, partial [Myxococcota bacterium]
APTPHKATPVRLDSEADTAPLSAIDPGSFEVEALTGPETPSLPVAAPVIEELQSMPIVPELADSMPGGPTTEPLEDSSDGDDDLGLGPYHGSQTDESSSANSDGPTSGRAATSARDDASAPSIELELSSLESAAGFDAPPAHSPLSSRPTPRPAAPQLGSPGPAASHTAQPAPAPIVTPYAKHPALDRLAHDLLGALEADAPAAESKRERRRRRVTGLFEQAEARYNAGDRMAAVIALDLAISEDPDSAITQKQIQLRRDAMCDMFQNYIGDAGATPALAVQMNELADENLDNRAMFLLSRIDGMLTVDELLDVSGMARVEAYRHLCVMLLKGILKLS